MKWYNLNRILSYNKVWNIIVGQRSRGKTYAVKKHCIKEALKYKGNFIWIRRYKADLELCATTEKFLSDLEENNEFPDYLITVCANAVYAENKKSKEIRQIGEFIPLSDYERIKSISWANYKNIVYDEFLSTKTVRAYLPNETFAFTSVVSSAFRHRTNVKIFCLANTVSMINPYFTALGIEKLEKRFTVINDITVIEYAQSDEFSKEMAETPSVKLAKIFGYESYVNESKFLHDDLSGVIKELEGNRRIIAKLFLHDNLITISMLNGILRCDTNAQQSKVFTIYKDNTLRDGAFLIDKRHPLCKQILKYYLNGNITFENLTIKNEIVDLCKLVYSGV